MPALAPFVESFWSVDDVTDADLPPGRERRLPSGQLQIVVNMAEDRLHWSEGPRLDRERSVGGAGLCGALAGRRAARTAAGVGATPAARLRTLEAAVLDRMGDRRRPDPAPSFASAPLALGHSVAGVVDSLGTIASTFTRRFRRTIGLAPTQFARIRRLPRVLRAAPGAGPEAGGNWAGLRPGTVSSTRPTRSTTSVC